MFLYLTTEINRLWKEINRLLSKLLSKGMSNIYLNISIEKNWRSQDFDILNLKHLSPGQFFGNYSSCRYYWVLKLLIET